MTARELYDLPESVRLRYLERCERQLEQLGGLLTPLSRLHTFDRLGGDALVARGVALVRSIKAAEEALEVFG